MEALRSAYEGLEEAEDEIMEELEKLELTTLEHLRITRRRLEESPLKHVDLKLSENFGKIEAFGNKLKTVADESDCALNNLRRAVNVVDTATVLYGSASRTLDHLSNDNVEGAFEQIERYIGAVAAAKAGGHWEDVERVLSRGYIGQVVAALRAVALDTLRSRVFSEHARLLTRLAVALGAEREAYASYLASLKLESERKMVSNVLSAPGGEVACLTRVIQNARNLMVRQAQAVFTELGPQYYIELAREIHKVASDEASSVFRDFVRLNFSQFLGHGPEIGSSAASEASEASSAASSAKGDDVIAEFERLLKRPSVVEAISSDPKYQKLLDTIATLASMWTDFENALRESTRPVYANILVRGDETRYGSDGLVFLSEATRSLQSILAVYVQLQHTFTLKAVVQAIQVSDTIYISQDDNMLTSTLVDDVFFILQKSQHRSIGTGDIQTACATFNQISGIISNELKSALMDNLVHSQPIYERWTQKLENLTHGSLFNMLEEHFRRTRGSAPDVIGSKYSFVHSLNNIEECLGLLAKFEQEMTECFSAEFLKDNQEKNLLVYNTIQALDLVRSELEQILDTCCNYALNMFKDHLTDPLNKFAAAEFEMDEEKYSLSQNEDSFADALVGVLQVVLRHVQTYYSPNVGLRCMTNLLEKVCKFMESCTLGKRFTVYGAVHFDAAVRALVYACSGYSQELRKQFTALLQISDVLNVNSPDDLTLLRESEPAIDVSKYAALRVDLANF